MTWAVAPTRLPNIQLRYAHSVERALNADALQTSRGRQGGGRSHRKTWRAYLIFCNRRGSAFRPASRDAAPLPPGGGNALYAHQPQQNVAVWKNVLNMRRLLPSYMVGATILSTYQTPLRQSRNAVPAHPDIRHCLLLPALFITYRHRSATGWTSGSKHYSQHGAQHKGVR